MDTNKKNKRQPVVQMYSGGDGKGSSNIFDTWQGNMEQERQEDEIQKVIDRGRFQEEMGRLRNVDLSKHVVKQPEPQATATEEKPATLPTGNINDAEASKGAFESWWETVEQERKRREDEDSEADRRGKINEMIGRIGDAAVAMNNLYHISNYAPYVRQERGVGDQISEREANDRAWREQNRRAWLNYALNVGREKRADERQKEQADLQQQRIEHAERVQQQRQEKAEKEAREKEMKRRRQETGQKYNAAWLNDEFGDADDKALRDMYDSQLEAGVIDKDEHDAIIGGLDDARTAYTTYIGKKSKDQQYKTASGGSKSSGGNYYKYIGFADGSGVNINKNDDGAITAIYDDKDFPEEYKAKGKYGRVKEKPTAQDKRDAVEAYLANNRNEKFEGRLRDVAKRSQKPRQQQVTATNSSKKKYANTKKLGL